MPLIYGDFGTHFIDQAIDYVLEVALSSPFAYKLWKLKETTGIIFLPTGEKELTMQRLKECEFTKKDAMFALELAIEYTLWAEQVYG